MKKKMKRIILTSGILIIHIFSYGSTALVRGSRRAIQLSGNNLMNLAAPAVPSVNSQSVPIDSNYSFQPMQTHQFKNQAVSSAPINIQKKSFSTQSDSQSLAKIPSENERASYFKNLNIDGLNNKDIAQLVDNTKYFSYKDLQDVNTEAQKKFLSRRMNETPFDDFNLSIWEFLYSTSFTQAERIDWLHRLLDDQSDSINIPLIERLFSTHEHVAQRGNLVRIIDNARSKVGNKPLDTLSIRNAILDFEFREKKSMMDKSKTKDLVYDEKLNESITIHYEKGKLRSIALHEASHALAQIESSIPFFVSTVTVEPRPGFLGFMYPNSSYRNIGVNSLSNQQLLQEVIIFLAGTVGEQVFDTYRYQGYSHEMLTDTNRIYDFLSSRIGAGRDFKYTLDYARYIAICEGYRDPYIGARVKEIIADCYIKTYKLISANKDVIEKLADAAMEKGTLHEDEIYAIVDKPRPLHDFEQGAMTESESAAFSQYRFPEQKINAKAAVDAIKISPQNNVSASMNATIKNNSTSGITAKNDVVPDAIKQKYEYDAQGKYVGNQGYRNEKGELLEVD